MRCDIGASRVLWRQTQHARDVEGYVAVADDDGTVTAQQGSGTGVIGVSVVPGDEVVCGARARQLGSRHVETAPLTGADRVYDRVVPLVQFVGRDVTAHLDIADETNAVTRGDLVEDACHALLLRMIGRDPAAYQTPRRGQPVINVDFHRSRCPRYERAVQPGSGGVLGELTCGVHTAGPGSHHGDP